MRPAWVEVDVAAIRENVQAMRACVGARVGVAAVVKADGYGHGLPQVARAALDGGAALLAVAIPDEVTRLREAGVTAPVLIMGCSLPHQAEEIIRGDAAAVVSTPEAARALADAARDLGRHARVHVKIDTGMGRVGVRWDQAVACLREIAALPGLEVEGIMTHFASADDEDLTAARTQFSRFVDVLDGAASAGIRPRYRHAANSAALAFLAESHLDLVRPGLSLYGVPPVPTSADDPDGETLPARPAPFPLRAALSLKARVVQVHALPAGDTVGYGHTFRTRRDSRIALLPLGYADGLSRALSNRGWALLHGYRVPIVGRVSMDQVCVDVTDLPDAAVGDEAVLIGSQGNETITAWEVGLAMHSIAYEALVSLSARLPRVYRG